MNFSKRWKINMTLTGIILACILSAVCIGFLHYLDTRNDADALVLEQSMRDLAVQEPDTVEIQAARESFGTQEVDPYLLRQIDFTALQEQNADAQRWVTIPETNIDYYVMQEQTIGSYFYLWRDINRQRSTWGSILTVAEPEGTDDAHLLMFGHNMKNKDVAFGSIRKHFKTAESADAYPYVYVYYPDHSERWLVWMAASVKANDTVYTYPYELYSDEYEELLVHMQKSARYEKMTRPSNDIRTLVLSTCNGDNVRFYIACVPDIFYEYGTGIVTDANMLRDADYTAYHQVVEQVDVEPEIDITYVIDDEIADVNENGATDEIIDEIMEDGTSDNTDVEMFDIEDVMDDSIDTTAAVVQEPDDATDEDSEVDIPIEQEDNSTGSSSSMEEWVRNRLHQ